MRRLDIPKLKLKELYEDKKWSISKVAKYFSCSGWVILHRLRKFGINSRTLSEANTIYPKKDFSRDNLEKAYLIGFRLGDLNVFKHYHSVRVKSNTTKIEQVSLIKNLFNKYSKVIVKRYNDKFFNIEFGLNKSFAFLLPKKDNIERWILDNKTYFLAFLSGYIDAEGNIGIYSNRARLRIRTYDKNILIQIHGKLKELNIYGTFRLESPAGKYGQNKDYWCVAVSKKEDLLRLFQQLSLKHLKRSKDLKRSEVNILTRIERNKDG